MIRRYSELIKLATFEERFDYAKLDGYVHDGVYGTERYLKQRFYQTYKIWRDVKRKVILRDKGLDLSCEDHEIIGSIYVHHLNPITGKDVLEMTPNLIDPEFLICVSKETNEAIHYGNQELLKTNKLVERFPNDTSPWRL